MCELIIDPELQRLLNASRDRASQRAAAYPHVQRKAPHAAGRPVSPPTAAAAITTPPPCTKADAVGNPLELS